QTIKDPRAQATHRLRSPLPRETEAWREVVLIRIGAALWIPGLSANKKDGLVDAGLSAREDGFGRWALRKIQTHRLATRVIKGRRNFIAHSEIDRELVRRPDLILHIERTDRLMAIHALHA